MKYSRYIINPESNIKVASELTPILNEFSTDIPCVRDNCGPINNELLCHLESNDVYATLVSGLFVVDDLSILDTNDLYKSERDYVKSTYGNTSNASIKKFVSTLSNDEQMEFYHITHYFLIYKNLILDAAYEMFSKYVNKIDESHYVFTTTKYISKVS